MRINLHPVDAGQGKKRRTDTQGASPRGKRSYSSVINHCLYPPKDHRRVPLARCYVHAPLFFHVTPFQDSTIATCCVRCTQQMIDTESFLSSFLKLVRIYKYPCFICCSLFNIFVTLKIVLNYCQLYINQVINVIKFWLHISLHNRIL